MTRIPDLLNRHHHIRGQRQSALEQVASLSCRVGGLLRAGKLRFNLRVLPTQCRSIRTNQRHHRNRGRPLLRLTIRAAARCIRFWDRLGGRWLRGKKFVYPDRPKDLSILREPTDTYKLGWQPLADSWGIDFLGRGQDRISKNFVSVQTNVVRKPLHSELRLVDFESERYPYAALLSRPILRFLN